MKKEKELGIKHNKDGLCPVCKYLKEMEGTEIDKYGKVKNTGKVIVKKESVEIIGDPAITSGKNQESVSTLKDMYGIFKIRDIDITSNKRSKSPKTSIKRRT